MSSDNFDSREQPLVAILIVNFNYARFLPEAIESALTQTWKNFEIIICDDGSTDGSREIIRDYERRDRRIRSILKTNAGVAAALNDSFRESRGDIITMLDADDLFLPSKLERVVAAFASDNGSGMAIHPLVKIDTEQRDLGMIPQLERLGRGDLRNLILQTGGIWAAPPTTGISFRRECAERVFPIPESQFRTEADGYMRNRAALLYSVVAIDEPLAVYRVHSSNVTATLTLDERWCEKGRSAVQRIHASVAETAREHSWPVKPLEETAAYRETAVVCDYLIGTSYSQNFRNALALFSSALLHRAMPKWALKACILSVAALLPRVIGTWIIRTLYLPGRAKRALGTRYNA